MPQASFPNLQSNNLQLASNWNLIPQGSNLNFTYNGSVVAQIPAGGSSVSIPTVVNEEDRYFSAIFGRSLKHLYDYLIQTPDRSRKMLS